MWKNKYVNLQLKYCTLLPTFFCLNTWPLFLDISLCALLISRLRSCVYECFHTHCIHCDLIHNGEVAPQKNRISFMSNTDLKNTAPPLRAV